MHHTEKGTTVNSTERNTKTLSSRTGLFATLRACFHAQGTGAPSHRPAWSQRLPLAVLAASLGIALFVPSLASAAFTRPFLRQLARTGTETGVSCSSEPSPAPACLRPRGVAVDASSDVWVANGEDHLSEFSPSGAFSANVELEGLAGVNVLNSFAVQGATGNFYVTSRHNGGSESRVAIYRPNGEFVEQSSLIYSNGSIAVDNSSDPFDPSRESVYLAQGSGDPAPPSGDGVPAGVARLSASGVPLEFSAAKECEEEHCGYIEGHTITGNPTQSFKGVRDIGGVAVDGEGDIYVVINQLSAGSVGEVDEYLPSGVFVRAFDGAESPGLGGNHEFGGFGGPVEGVTVDPASGHVLVSVQTGLGEPSHGAAVDEFDASGRFVNQFTQTEVEVSAGVRHPGALKSASALMTDAAGDVYVLDDQEEVVDEYGPGHFLPSLRLAEASERKPTTATLSGEVDPEGLALSDCVFEYVSEAAFKASGFSDLSSGGEKPCVPPAASIPVDSKFHPIEAKLIGLSSGTTYRYRLTATSSGGLGGTEHGITLAFTAPHAPAIESTTVANLSSAFADLHASIDPLGADTTYQFQYLTQAEYAANGESFSGEDVPTVVPVPAADIGSGGPAGSSLESVGEQIGGLQPGTAYRFRVVAGNEVGVTPGPAEMFATLPRVSLGLPDNRAYELVTPPDKGSATDMFGAAGGDHHNEFINADVGVSSESGDAFLLTTSAAAFGPFPASFQNAYLFHRTPVGWQATSLASPGLGVQSIASTVFDPIDFSRVGIDDNVGSVSSSAGSSLTALLGSPGGPYTALLAEPPMGAEVGEERFLLVGGSRDLSHVVLETKNHALCPGDEAQDEGSNALCEYSAGKYTLLNVNSKGKLAGPFACGAVLGLAHTPGTRHDAVSVDGSRVLFTAPDPYARNKGAGCWNGAAVYTPQLYQRSGGETLELSAPVAALSVERGRHPAGFAGASADGSRVFFLSEAELTKDDAGIHDSELYEWRSPGTPGAEALPSESPASCAESSSSYNPVSKGCLVRVSRGESGKVSANVDLVPVVSADGSAVYFTANGVLAANSGTGGAHASPGSCEPPKGPGGSCNLYRYDTATGAAAYVATVEHEDFHLGTGTKQGAWGTEFSLRALEPAASWYTPPDGRYLLFTSRRDLTGYSTVPAAPGDCREYTSSNAQAQRAGCAEVYRYDSAAGGSLACLSCNPAGAAPSANAGFAQNAVSSIDPADGQVRALSDDGSYAFFQTPEALVPDDVNGTIDVYEWHEGHGLSLISSGRDKAPSFFVGVSANGSNVFFGTHAELVPQDTNTGGDLYDARICTESDPCIKPSPGETAQCEGGACQSPPVAPSDPTATLLAPPAPVNLAGKTMKKVTKKTTPCKKVVVKRKAKKKTECIKPKSKKNAKKSSHGRAGR